MTEQTPTAATRPDVTDMLTEAAAAMVSSTYPAPQAEEGKLLEHTMFYTQDPAEFAAKDLSGEFAKIVVDFEERPTGTWVKFSQYGELPEEHIPMAKAGMESYFQSLADYLG